MGEIEWLMDNADSTKPRRPDGAQTRLHALHDVQASGNFPWIFTF